MEQKRLTVWRNKGDAGASEVVSDHVGAATRPAGPLPSSWPPMVLSNGLKPSSSTGMPNDTSFDSYVRSKSLCACVGRYNMESSDVTKHVTSDETTTNNLFFFKV